MKWMLFAASAAIAAGLWLPGPVTMSYAAQPAAPAETAATLPATGEDKITFDQYREWRLRFIERRQTQLAAQLAAAELQPRQRARLEQTKAYYDWFAGLGEAERDRRFRERFDQMDANHDGVVDPAERAAGTISSAPFSAGAGPPPPNPPPRVSPASRPSPVVSLQKQTEPAR